MLTEERTILNCLLEAKFTVQPDGLPHPLIRQYQNGVNEFLEYLILLILLEGEQQDGDLYASQGFVSELVSLRFANGMGFPRHITVQNGTVFISTRHDDPLPRIRTLPKHVGTLMVIYLAHVRPFLAKISPHHPAISSNFLFPTAEGHWHTESYTVLIPRESQSRLNKTLVLEDINEAYYMRSIKEIGRNSLSQAMWGRPDVDSGGYARQLGNSEQLPSSEILQQLRTQQFRTPSPSNSDISLANQVSDSSQFPLCTTSFPCWTPSPSPDVVADPMSAPDYFSSIIPYQHYSFSASGHSSIAGTAPPSPVRRVPHIEPQGSITRLAFIDGYPKQARKHTANPKSAAKAKNKKSKQSKVLKTTPPKKSPKSVKAAIRGTQNQSQQNNDDDETTSSAGSIRSADMILENLGLTSSFLKNEVHEQGVLNNTEHAPEPTSLAACVNDPITHTNKMLSNLRLQFLVTK